MYCSVNKSGSFNVYKCKQLNVYICKMKNDVVKTLVNSYSIFKEKSIKGTYITLDNIKPLITKFKDIYSVKEIGYSFLKKPIYSIQVGEGDLKILIWSQMHGNEATGTKVIFDLLNLFGSDIDVNNGLKQEILSKVTILFIPMLNPDGATLFTRENAQNIDLNRDAVDLKAPESKLLNRILHQFKPKYCFNLHDQRTVFSVGKQNNPATISLLAPSEDINRTLTTGRKETMQVIASMYTDLKKLIPNQIGRYTDEFYPTATGDNFQKAGFNTVLIEAGHYKDDYLREKTRFYNFIALFSGIYHITFNSFVDYKIYLEIPENKKDYFDLLYTNILLETKKIVVGLTRIERIEQEGIQYYYTHLILERNKEYGCNKLKSNNLKFSNISELKKYFTNIK